MGIYDKSIGGYFELEMPKTHHVFHDGALSFSTARNCLEYILLSKQYKKLYIPYYTCSSILEPITKLHVQYEYYRISLDLEPIDYPNLLPGEAFLYTNYFGCKDSFLNKLVLRYHGQLIIDNSQSFFSKNLPGTDTFYSARKFFGVPDGAYLYTDGHLDCDFEPCESYYRMSHLLKRLDKDAAFGYEDFHLNEKSFSGQPIMMMSSISSSILSSVDYDEVINRRRGNFEYISNVLDEKNIIHLGDEVNVPMVYPFLFSDSLLRGKLIRNKVFVAKYWPNVNDENYSNEVYLADHLIPLPIDQRYDEKDMDRILELINYECNA